MARNVVHVQMTVAESQAVQAWLNARRSVGAYEAQIRQTGQTAQTSNRQINTSTNESLALLGRATATLGGLGLALKGIHSFAQMVRSEMEAVRQASERGQENLSGFGRPFLSGLAASFPQNMQFRGMTDREQIVQRMEMELLDPSAGFMVMPNDLERIMNAAVSAGTGADITNRFDMGKFIATMQPEQTMEEKMRLAQITAAIMEAFPEKDFREIISLMQQGAAQSIAGEADFGSFTTNMGPAMVRLAQNLGLDFSEAVAVGASFMSRGVDPTGETSRTAMDNLGDDITSLMMTIGEFDRLAEARENTTGREMLEFLRNDIEFQRKMLGAFSMMVQQEAAGFGQDAATFIAIAEGREVDELTRGQMTGAARARARNMATVREFLTSLDVLQNAGVHGSTTEKFEDIMDALLVGDDAVASLDDLEELAMRTRGGRAFRTQRTMEVAGAFAALDHQPARAQRDLLRSEILPSLMPAGAGPLQMIGRIADPFMDMIASREFPDQEEFMARVQTRSMLMQALRSNQVDVEGARTGVSGSGLERMAQVRFNLQDQIINEMTGPNQRRALAVLQILESIDENIAAIVINEAEGRGASASVVPPRRSDAGMTNE